MLLIASFHDIVVTVLDVVFAGFLIGFEVVILALRYQQACEVRFDVQFGLLPALEAVELVVLSDLNRAEQRLELF